MPLTDEQWLQVQQAIWNGEQSGGNYTSYNSSSGAAGAYQFMPETWREKANMYGYSDYADIPNASYAPADVQDAVARGWASDLYDKYGGDIRYVLNAWLSGEGAADADYAQGTISSTRNDGAISASDYVSRALEGSEYARPVESTLDFELITTNNPDQSVTNTDNLRPESIYGANTLGAYMMSNYNTPLMITGGAEIGYHAKSSTGHGHEDGWKIDVANDEIAGGTQGGEEFKSFCNQQGWSANWEDDHWDIDFSGTDSRDPQSGGFSGNIFGEAATMGNGSDYSYANQLMGSYSPERQNDWYEPESKPSFWDAVSTGFQHGLTTTGFAYVAQSLWGNLFHSSNHFGAVDKVTQADIDYVKNALPDDPDAQKFALLNGRDSEEIKWLVNQKLVDKKREQEIAEYNDGCTFTIANAAQMVGGAIDPTMLIPAGAAFNGLKITSRLGKAIYDISKVSTTAQKAARMGIVLGNKVAPAVRVGASASVGVTADNLLRESFGGIKPEYGWDAAVAFAGGSVLGGIGGLFRHANKGTPAIEQVAKVADKIETQAINHAADLTTVRSETINNALKIHDVDYGKTLKSKYYAKLEKNQRVVATSYEKARELVSKASGIEIPKNAKAFYVPNEDYTILIKDNIKPTEIDSILSHEFSVHAGLRSLLGDKSFTKFMDEISDFANKEGHIFNEARKRADSYDPEEIFAYAVENDMLPKGILSNLKGLINVGLKREGFSSKVTSAQVKDLLVQQADAVREMRSGIHYNTDGSTAFGGIRFSKDNFLNPDVWAKYFSLEQQVSKETQSDIPFWMPKRFSRWLENAQFGFGTPDGILINSNSNTIRGTINRLFDDVRGRGLGHVDTISAETNKLRLQNLLYEPYLKYASERQSWCLKNKQMGRSAMQAFDKLMILAYNSKYAGNKANIPKDFPEEVLRAVEHMKEMRDLQIELGKRSADDVGAKGVDNIVEKDWEAVDNELWRVVDEDQRMKFINNFKDGADGAEKFLDEYYRRFAKRDVIRAKIQRDIDKRNQKIQKENDSIPEGSTRKPRALISRDVSDAMIDNWIDEHVPAAVKFTIRNSFDTTLKENVSSLGNLSFFKERVPIDTTGVLKMPNGLEFSFDNNLRSYDLDTIIHKNVNRFAGEASVKNVFGDQRGLEQFLKSAKDELMVAYKTGAINKGKADVEYQTLENSVYELRGIRPDIDAISRLGALARILRNLAYAKNGANMGFAQLGELGGTIAYGGLSQLAHLFKPLGRIIENARWGKVEATMLRDVERQMFGANIESQIWTMNYGDRVIRDALTQNNSLMNKALIMVGDMTANLGKVTSSLNMLPKMTDAMIRGMRVQTIVDSIDWANGFKISSKRNPFSKAKLKASHISEKDAERIKESISKYYQWDYDTEIDKLDVRKWQLEDPTSFAKWYGLVQAQAERAIINGSRIGNRSVLKDMNPLTQLAFQFKDYSFRAINAQTMRAMTARDFDDAMATILSIITNTAAYAIKAGATYAAIKATGADKKAQEYADRMLSKENLLRAAAFRSAILGSPFSMVNDLGEATGVWDTSIRTSINRGTYGRPDNVGDAVGNFIAQSPGLQQAGAPVDMMRFFYNVSNNEANKRDFKKALQALPIPQWIPVATYLNHFVDQSDLPEKRPKK